MKILLVFYVTFLVMILSSCSFPTETYQIPLSDFNTEVYNNLHAPNIDSYFLVNTVDEYIDEFRKELENIGGAQPESVVVQPDKPVETKPTPVSVSVQEPVSLSLSDEQLDELAKQFVPECAEKLARSILEKLDVKRALKTAADEFIARSKKG